MDTPLDAEITPGRLEELIRWHGTDESNLPPAHTLKNLARDTVAALRELQQSRQRIERLRAAMGRVFWAHDPRELHAMLLVALGPPPEEASGGSTGATAQPAGVAPDGWTANWTASRSPRREGAE